MKIFQGFNELGPACPVCKTKDDKPCTLVPIVGSNTEGDEFTHEAKPVHIDCLDLWYYDNKLVQMPDMIVQTIHDEEKNT